MPSSKITAGAFGAVYTLVGILGFVGPAAPGGNLLGIFAVTPMLNIVHLLIGLTGLGVYFLAPNMVRSWAQAVGVVLGLVAVVGVIIPNPIDGLPIGGFNIVLHAVSAVVLLYVGFSSERRETATA